MGLDYEPVGGRSPAIGNGAGATTIEDLPADVLALVLRRLDGASLAALGYASSALRALAADPAAWRGLCLAAWPSLRDCAAAGRQRHRALFADAFPFPAAAPPEPAAARSPLPASLVSAVDLRHAGACVVSRVVETDAASAWFLGSPFRVDALVQEGFTAPAAPIAPADLSLSWILIDLATGRAVNASSRRPVAVDRKWLTGDVVVRFGLVLGAGTGGLRHGGPEEEAAQWYREFVKGKRARKEWKARREGMLDLCCSGVGAAAFLSFLVMFMCR